LLFTRWSMPLKKKNGVNGELTSWGVGEDGYSSNYPLFIDLILLSLSIHNLMYNSFVG